MPPPGDLIPTKLFFAVVPPASLWPRIESLTDILQRAHGFRGNPIRGQRLHATMAGIFDSGRALEDVVAKAKQVADGIRHRAFPVCFDKTQSFANRDPHPFVLAGGGEPLKEFQRVLADRMWRADLAVDRSFSAHITMLWADRCVGENPIAPICWTAREFVLVMSLQGQSRHVHLAHWALN